MATTHQDKQRFFGGAEFRRPGSIDGDDAMIPARMIDGSFAADQVTHRIDARWIDMGTVGDTTEMFHIAHGAGKTILLCAFLVTKPGVGDQVSIDVEAFVSGSWSTILSAPIVYTNASANNELKLQSSGVEYAAGTVFRVVIAVDGTTAAGLAVSQCFEEAAAA